VIDNEELAATYEAFLRHDFDVAHANGPSRAAMFAIAPPDEMPPEFLAEARAAWQFFKPLVLTNEPATITPLLTPDPGVYQKAMLKLLKSARRKLYIQLQYIHPSDKDEDQAFSALIDTVSGKIQEGLDVRIITSQFQTSQGWLERLQAAGIDLSAVKIQNGVHNKGFVVDSKIVALGSQNWSGDGVLRNRDSSVIIENKKAAQYYEKIFLHDWVNVARQSMKP